MRHTIQSLVEVLVMDTSQLAPFHHVKGTDLLKGGFASASLDR